MINSIKTKTLFAQLHKEYPDDILLRIIEKEWESWDQKYLFSDDRIKRKELVQDLLDLFKKYSASQTDSQRMEISTIEPAIRERSYDLRINGLFFNNIKGFGKKIEGKNFGIDLSKNESLVLLAENGLGKSSIFSLLEYLYTDKISEAILRGLDQDENYQISFLQNLRNRGMEPECRLLFNDQVELTLEKRLSHNISDYNKTDLDYFNPEVAFLSELNIYKQNQENVEGFEIRLSTIFGFKELVSIASFLEYLSSNESKLNTISPFKDLTETKLEIGKAELRLDDISKELEKLIQVQTSQRGSEDQSLLISDLRTKINLIDPILSKNYNIRSLRDMRRKLTQLENELNKIANIANLEFLNDEITFLQNGLKIFSGEDCPFCNNSKLLKSEIIKSVKNKLKIQQDKLSSLDKLANKIKDLLETEWSSLINDLNRIREEIENINSKNLFREDESYNKYLDAVNSINQIFNANLIVDFGDIYFYNTKKIDIKRLNISVIKNIINQIENYLNNLPLSLFTDRDIFREYTEARDFMLLNIKEISNRMVKEYENSSTKEKIAEMIYWEEMIKRLQSERITLTASLEELLLRQKHFEEAKENYHELTKNLPRIKDTIDNFIRDEMNNLISNDFVKIVNNLMELYFQSDSVKFNLVLSERDIDEMSVKKLNFEVLDSISDSIITDDPKKYFNSSRFKLLGLVINLAVYILQRKESKFNLPLCIDDEFFGVDLRNKIQSKNLFKNLFESIIDHNPEHKPIQFIFFIHDQIIFENIKNAIEELNYDIELISKIFPSGIQFSKMFDTKKKINLIKESFSMPSHKTIEYNSFIYTLKHIQFIQQQKKVQYA